MDDYTNWKPEPNPKFPWPVVAFAVAIVICAAVLWGILPS